MLEPHTALFVAPTEQRKHIYPWIYLREREYFDHFHLIVIICTTLRYNATYENRKWFWTDPYIITIEPGNRLYDCIENIGNLLAGSRTLFLIDDIIADETLDK